MDKRWQRFDGRLNHLVDVGKCSQTLADAVRSFRRAVPTADQHFPIPETMVGTTGENVSSLTLSWEAVAHHVDINIADGGQINWSYSDEIANVCASGDYAANEYVVDDGSPVLADELWQYLLTVKSTVDEKWNECGVRYRQAVQDKADEARRHLRWVQQMTADDVIFLALCAAGRYGEVKKMLAAGGMYVDVLNQGKTEADNAGHHGAATLIANSKMVVLAEGEK